MMRADGNLVRINRDDLRAMSILKWTPKREDWIIQGEIFLAQAAAKCKKNIIIDDTNLYQKDTDRWKNVAIQLGYTFEKKELKVSLEECVRRDATRSGIARLGRPTIERQFLRAGLWDINQFEEWAIWDVDGTLADLTHRTPWITPGAICPVCGGWGRFKTTCTGVDQNSEPMYEYKDCEACECTGKIQKKNHDAFYSLVHLDEPIPVVISWLRAWHDAGKGVIICSGRSPEKCGEETVTWLYDNGCPFHHIIMRRSNCHGPDDEEKQLILDDLLKILPKEKIAFVVDDRPSVVRMWKRNGLKVYPVRGRDDDKFYELMDKLEVEHPRPDLEEEQCIKSSGTPASQ